MSQHASTRPTVAASAEPAEPAPLVKRPWLLGLAIALLGLWLCFLGYMAFR